MCYLIYPEITFHFVKSSLPLPTKKAFPTGCLPCCWLPQKTGINPGKFSLFNRTQGETFLDMVFAKASFQLRIRVLFLGSLATVPRPSPF